MNRASDGLAYAPIAPGRPGRSSWQPHVSALVSAAVAEEAQWQRTGKVSDAALDESYREGAGGRSNARREGQDTGIR
jgi:hypothetical protein